MSNNSFEQFFNKCNEEHRIPSSSEIFDELKNYGIFEGTELKKRDVSNLMAVSVFIKSIWEFLCNDSGKEKIPYAMISEVTGGLVYGVHIKNIGVLMLKAFEKWSPGCSTKIYPNVKAAKGASCLDTIFDNLKAYLEKQFEEKLDYYNKEYDNLEKDVRIIFIESMEKICPENCEALKMYAVFKSYCMIPDIQNFAVSYAAMFVENQEIAIVEEIFQVLDTNEPLVRTK